MSGEKVARVDLDAAARVELSRILNESRENARLLARLSNLTGRLRSLLEECERYLGSPDISQGMRQRLEAFLALVKLFNAKHQELRARLDQMEKLGQNTNPQAARNEAKKLQDEIRRLTEELNRLATQINERTPEIEASLAAEGRTEEYRARMADQKLRGELAGLLEELKLRLHPAMNLNLQSVSERALSLLARIENSLAQQGKISEAEVRTCRTELDTLTREVEEREGEIEEQWAIFSRLDDAFQRAGFQRNTPAQRPQFGIPIQATHSIMEDDLRASVISQVYRGGTVNLEMFGASGEGADVLGRDQHCDLNLNRIVSKALECGLVVKSVAWKDPNAPDDLIELDIPGVGDYEYEEQPQSSSNKRTEGQTRAINIRE